MKFAVLGGDDRSLLLCSILARAGHRVHSYGLERGSLPGEIPRSGCLQGCVYGADCLVLPVPAQREGLLNAPYAAQDTALEELLPVLWPGQVLIGGKLPQAFALEAVRQGLAVQDLLLQKGFTVGNAALTAEGAVELMMSKSPGCLWRSKCLVTGFGRLGRLLALRLSALGARVTVAARGEGDRAMARALGLEAAGFEALEESIESFSYIANTVPAQVLSTELLEKISPQALVLELASPPGGFDKGAAAALGLNCICAPGLPGICAPQAAAELLAQAILKIMKESGA